MLNKNELYCDKCGIATKRTSNNQKYCKSCSIAVRALQMRLCKQKKRKEQLFSEHMQRKSDGTPDFEKERKDIIHLLKYYGLRK